MKTKLAGGDVCELRSGSKHLGRAKLRTIAMSLTLWSVGCVASAQTVTPPENCTNGLQPILALVGQFNACVKDQAIQLEHSHEAADIVARAAVTACGYIADSAVIGARACDFVGKSTALVSTVNDAEKAALDQALLVVVRVRASR